MKKLNLFLTRIALFAMIAFCACGSGNDASEDDSDTTIGQLEEKMDNIESGDTDSLKAGGTNELGKEYTAKYVCPMHCKGSGSDKAGTCSVCGMDLIENPNQQKK